MKQLLIAVSFILILQACTASYSQSVTHTDGSELGVTIIGTIIGKDNDNVALIKEMKSNQVKAVKRGHLVLDQAFAVGKVDATYIVLVKPGEKNFHYVYKDKFGKSDANLAAKSPEKSLAEQDYYSEDGFERKRDNDQNSVKMTSAFRDKIVKEDLSKIMMQAAAVPHIENGSIVGFQLLQIDEGSIFSKAGFRDGDVITNINGTELTSASGAVSLLRSLQGANNLNVEILRSGSKESMAVSID